MNISLFWITLRNSSRFKRVRLLFRSLFMCIGLFWFFWRSLFALCGLFFICQEYRGADALHQRMRALLFATPLVLFVNVAFIGLFPCVVSLDYFWFFFVFRNTVALTHYACIPLRNSSRFICKRLLIGLIFMCTSLFWLFFDFFVSLGILRRWHTTPRTHALLFATLPSWLKGRWKVQNFSNLMFSWFYILISKIE